MVTLATLLPVTTFKTESTRQMKRKPDQLKIKNQQAVLRTTPFSKALKSKENVSPTTFKNSKQMTLSTKFNFNLQLYKNTNQKKKTLNKALIRENQ